MNDGLIANAILDSYPKNPTHFLTVIEGNDFARVFTLNNIDTVVGRSEIADIRLDDEKVSKRHLVLSIVTLQNSPLTDQHSFLAIMDLNSKNGTYVNGERITDRQLKPGDRIKVGDTVLKYEVRDALDLDMYQHQRLYERANVDPLTNVYNRNYSLGQLNKFIDSASCDNRSVALMLIDLDHFKKINTTLGHDIGDEVLKIVAGIIANNLRPHDITARFGGEEFIILLPETDIDGAMKVAEEKRQTVASHNFAAIGCHQTVTISIGVAAFPVSGSNRDELIQRADQALYQAKSNGRNCISKYDPSRI